MVEEKSLRFKDVADLAARAREESSRFKASGPAILRPKPASGARLQYVPEIILAARVPQQMQLLDKIRGRALGFAALQMAALCKLRRGHESHCSTVSPPRTSGFRG